MKFNKTVLFVFFFAFCFSFAAFSQDKLDSVKIKVTEISEDIRTLSIESPSRVLLFSGMRKYLSENHYDVIHHDSLISLELSNEKVVQRNEMFYLSVDIIKNIDVVESAYEPIVRIPNNLSVIDTSGITTIMLKDDNYRSLMIRLSKVLSDTRYYFKHLGNMKIVSYRGSLILRGNIRAVYYAPILTEKFWDQLEEIMDPDSEIEFFTWDTQSISKQDQERLKSLGINCSEYSMFLKSPNLEIWTIPNGKQQRGKFVFQKK